MLKRYFVLADCGRRFVVSAFSEKDAESLIRNDQKNPDPLLCTEGIPVHKTVHIAKGTLPCMTLRDYALAKR